MSSAAIDSKKDSFYGGNYTVINKVSLNMFNPKDNNNKFYILEAHSNNKGEYRLYANYGRVGSKGQHVSKAYDSLSRLQSEFNKTVVSKEKKGYNKVDLVTTSRGSDVGKTIVNANSLGNLVDAKKIKTKSKLSPKVIDLVTKIYTEANQAVNISMNGTVNGDIKAPLGNLGVEGIDKGKYILGEIAKAMQNKDDYRVEQYSMMYYKYIPRKLPTNLRMDKSWMIDTQSKIDKELDILKLYEDTLRMLPAMGVSDIDVKYKALNCNIEHVTDKETIDYIENKIANGYAPNHRFRAKLKNVYEIKQKNAPRFDNSCGNVRMMFHGTKGANLVGILSSHLKLPTQLKGVHITGAMFGPGIYFGEFSKSLQYSMNRFGGGANKTNSVYMFVCEVAMGNVYKATKAHYYTKAPNGYHSVMGVGEATLKRMKDRGEISSSATTSLINNEFIIYNQSRQRIKYLLELEMI